MTIDRNSGIPYHIQVEKLIREMIVSEKYQNGSLLPKEVDLALKLGLSRNTVRQAISKLVNEGLLERKKGIGTKVVEPVISTQLENWMSFTKEMEKRGVKIINYEIKVEKVAADKEVATALEIGEGKEVIKLSRLRGDKEGPFVLFVSWFHPRIELTGNEDFTRPLYELLENDYSTVSVLSKELIQAIAADERIAKILGIPISSPVLKRIRKVYDPGKRAIEYGLCFYRADKFSYSIEINRKM